MLPVVTVKGKPGEAGYQYGTKCREMIQKNVQLYFRLFQHYAQLDRVPAISLAKRFIPVIQAFDPAILEEIRGIAEGANLDFEELLAINTRTELMFPESLAPGGECTSMV